MHYNVINDCHHNSLSLFYYLTSGYIIIFLFFFLSRYEFFPLHSCFNWINSNTFNWSLYQEVMLYYMGVYTIYAVIAIFNFAMQECLVLQKFHITCLRFMEYYQTLLLPFSTIVILCRYISKPFIFHIITSQYYCYTTVWYIFFSSVIAGFFLVPFILIYFTLDRLRTKYKSINITLDYYLKANTVMKLATIKYRILRILIKQNMIIQFIYWYSILTLWGVFALSIFYIFIQMPSSLNKGDYGFGGLFSCEANGKLITITLGYFIFAIILRQIIKCIVKYCKKLYYIYFNS